MLIDRITNRWQAFAIHLAISIVIFLLLAAVIYRWYPGVLFKYDGGLEGIKLIAGVDLVIGPLLTLLVYNTAKKSLKKDLTIIGVLQIACLIGGMWTVYQTRPVAVVYADGAFRSMPYLLYQDAGVDISANELMSENKWPVFVFVKNHEQSVPMGITNDKTFADAPNYALQDNNFSQRICTQGKTYNQWQWQPAIKSYGELPEQQRFFPAGLGIGSGFIVFDCESAEIMDFIPETTRSSAWENLKHKWF